MSMQLGIVIHRYFPYGGLQRDFHRFLLEFQRLGHVCRVYCMSWQGEAIEGVDLRLFPARGLSNHQRVRRFEEKVLADLVNDPLQCLIGFNKMPGLDIYFAGDACYLNMALSEHGFLYRRGGRFRHYAASERAVFGQGSDTHIFCLTTKQRDEYEKHYGEHRGRTHLLPPGVAPQRRAPEDADKQRQLIRQSLGLQSQDLVLLFVGSAFATKGLDRAIAALAILCDEQPSVSVKLLVVGQGKKHAFLRRAKRLGVADKLDFLGGREDIRELMLGADLLVHPARREAAGIVLLEAIAAGLPIVTTQACGYAHYVTEARAGIVLEAPFSHEALARAMMRNIDGVFRAECRRSELLYSGLTDLYSMHATGAQQMLDIAAQRPGITRG